MDGERVVGVPIGMLLERHLSVLLLDVTGSRVRRNVQNRERVESLKRLNLRNDASVDVPDVPEEGGANQLNVEGGSEGVLTGLSAFEIDEGDHARARVRRVLLDVGFAPNERGKETPSNGDQDEGQDRNREIVEGAVVVLQHLLLRLRVALKVVLKV